MKDGKDKGQAEASCSLQRPDNVFFVLCSLSYSLLAACGFDVRGSGMAACWGWNVACFLSLVYETVYVSRPSHSGEERATQTLAPRFLLPNLISHSP